MFTKVRQALLAIALVLGLMAPEASANCESSYFPVYAGGAKGDERVSCFVYDPLQQLIIVGGVTKSEDFAPAPNEHGYLFALDIYGNWKWGSFFYNVSYAVSSIEGCQLSSTGESLALTGIGNSMPLLMDINTVDGTFNKFISIDYIESSATAVPQYTTFGAIYYDMSDYRDYQPYFYTAFLKDEVMFMLRVADSDQNLIVDWNQMFNDYDADQVALEPLLNEKEPAFMTPDPRQTSQMYMIGRYRGKGSIYRFNKRDGSLRWHAQFEEMSRINSVAVTEAMNDLFICGEWQPNEANDATPPAITIEYQATIARVNDEGDAQWIIKSSGAHPLATGSNDYAPQDKCMAISFYPEEDRIVTIIQGKMTEVRDSYKGDFFDTILMEMDDSGEPKKVVVISQNTLNYDMYTSRNGVFQLGDDVFFSGYSKGFRTQLQTLEKTDTSNEDTDAYVYKYNFNIGNKCLYIKEADDRAMARRNDKVVGMDNIEAAGIYSLTTTFRSLPISPKDNYYIPYKSRYSGGFDLLDTMKIPRPCAATSLNLTSVQYYRGQNTLSYDIFAENSASFIDGEPRIIFQNGEPADSLATFDPLQFVVNIQTDDEDVGKKKTIIRSCSNLDTLLELNLYIEVLANTYPDFETEPQTAFTVAVNDIYHYPLPAVSDPEGNDEPEVYVGYMDSQESKYPEFMQFDNETRTITLNPDSKIYADKTFYFTIVVKEKNSDSVKYQFYATVRVEGTGVPADEVAWDIVPNDSNITTVNYTINWVDEEGSGRGSLKFDSPINMYWLEQNFLNLFNVYWRDTTYRDTKENKTLQDFILTDFNEDGMTVNFTMKFSKPYRIGLLVKKSDRIHIDVKEDPESLALYNATGGLWLGDPKTYRLGNTESKHRLEMIFDFENDVMKTMRDIAKTMYWVLIAIILAQFVALTWRGVGLLPVWVFIEYLQLVGFMPIYNFRLIPYLYDAFKPSLVAHAIIFDDTPFIDDLDEEYFNDNYKKYWLSVGKLFQSFFFVCILLGFVLLANVVVFIMYKMNCRNQTLNGWANKKITQFKFNVYLRYYMLVYFDTTFFSVMKIMDPDNSTVARKAALLLSYVLFVINIILPVFLIFHINRRFDILAMKEAKQSFNTLLLKIDKASRWRIMNPAYFFARRLLTAMLLTLPIENTFIFLQYVFILMSSHAYILYMVAVKPFQTPGINSYVLASETFYSALIIAIFIFSDATPEMSIKFGAGVALIVSLILLVLSNIIMNVYYLWQGPKKIKKTIKEATLKRAEKEALERAEEEERKLKKKKEEEEFTKIPDESLGMSSIHDPNANTTQGYPGDISEIGGTKKRKGKNKKKGDEDNVNEAGIGGVGQDDFSQPPTKKKRRKDKDKDKNKQDDLAEGTIAGPTKSKKRRKKQTEEADPTTTTNHQTDFGTSVPTTQKDLL